MDSPPAPLARLSWLALKIVNLTFGGGEPTLAVFYRELVENHRWLTAQQYGMIFGLARLTPGTNLLAFVVGAGWILQGWTGALMVALASSVPSAIVVAWFTGALNAIDSYPLAKAAIGGMIAAAVGLMAGAAVKLLTGEWKPGRRMSTGVYFVVFLALSFGLGWSPVQVLGVAALIGLVSTWIPGLQPKSGPVA